jgi:hypothetical protein
MDVKLRKEADEVLQRLIHSFNHGNAFQEYNKIGDEYLNRSEAIRFQLIISVLIEDEFISDGGGREGTW